MSFFGYLETFLLLEANNILKMLRLFSLPVRLHKVNHITIAYHNFHKRSTSVYHDNMHRVWTRGDFAHEMHEGPSQETVFPRWHVVPASLNRALTEIQRLKGYRSPAWFEASTLLASRSVSRSIKIGQEPIKIQHLAPTLGEYVYNDEQINHHQPGLLSGNHTQMRSQVRSPYEEYIVALQEKKKQARLASRLERKQKKQKPSSH